MSDIIKIKDVAALIGDITKTFENEAQTADMLVSSYKTVCGDPEISDNEKRYFDRALDGVLRQLDAVRNPQIFDSGNKKAIKLFFFPSNRKVPEAFKDGALEKEDAFYKRMGVIYPEIFRSGTHFEKLIRLYVSGCPARVTEVYADPLTALYASLAEGGEGITVFAVSVEALSYPDSDRALILSCLPKLSFAKKRDLLETAYASLISNRFQQLKGGSRYLDDAPEELYKEIATEKPFFRRDTDPADLLRPLFVTPYGSGDKAYIIHGLCVNEKEAKTRINAITVREYAVNDRQKILDGLSLLGFDGLRLCKDAKDAAEYLKQNI